MHVRQVYSTICSSDHAYDLHCSTDLYQRSVIAVTLACYLSGAKPKFEPITMIIQLDTYRVGTILWNLKYDTIIFIQQFVFVNVVSKISAI